MVKNSTFLSQIYTCIYSQLFLSKTFRGFNLFFLFSHHSPQLVSPRFEVDVISYVRLVTTKSCLLRLLYRVVSIRRTLPLPLHIPKICAGSLIVVSRGSIAYLSWSSSIVNPHWEWHLQVKEVVSDSPNIKYLLTYPCGDHLFTSIYYKINTVSQINK